MSDTQSLQPHHEPVRPHHAGDFRCIGGDCEDTCCHGWGVIVDKKIYEKYQGFEDLYLRAITQQYVSINPAGSSDTLYARIGLTPSQDCPFLATDRLCSVQKEHGHEYLSTTCSTFPRAMNKVQNVFEVSLYLSCPEAARKVLLNPDLLGAGGRAKSGSGVEKASDAHGGPHREFHLIRSFVVELLQDRSYPMWQRVFLLGAFCQRLDGIVSSGQDGMVAQLLSDYRTVVVGGGLRDAMNGMEAQPAMQVDTLLWLVEQRIRAGSAGSRFQECYKDFLEGIGYAPESNHESWVGCYVEAEKNYFRPFTETHPHVLENYLLNYVFRTVFPFGRESSVHYTPQAIFGEYVSMVGQFAMVRGLLIGMAGRYKEAFSEANVVKLVQSFSKTVEHSPALLNDISACMQSRGLASIAGAAAMVR